MKIEEIRNELLNMQDISYKNFHQKLMPTVNPDAVIGVRTPLLKKYVKEIKNLDTTEFLNDLPHKYYEENNLHAFLIAEIKDFNECIYKLDIFLPYIDNWATCDSLKPKCFKKNRDKLLIKINEWIKSDKTYTVRFAINMLMTHFLDEDFKEEYLKMVASVKSEEYYINMCIAWYFATALAKQYDSTFPYIEKKVLSDWVHNKSIQKAVESYRISDSQKQILKSLKV